MGGPYEDQREEMGPGEKQVGLANIPKWGYSWTHRRNDGESVKDYRRRVGRYFVSWREFKKENGNIILGAMKRWPDPLGKPSLYAIDGYAITSREYKATQSQCRGHIKKKFIETLVWEVQQEINLCGDDEQAKIEARFHGKDGIRKLENNHECPLCQFGIPGAMNQDPKKGLMRIIDPNHPEGFHDKGGVLAKCLCVVDD